MQTSSKSRPKSPAARNPYADVPTSAFIHSGEFSSKGSSGRDMRQPVRKNIPLNPISSSKSGLSPQNSVASVRDHGHGLSRVEHVSSRSESENDRLRNQLSVLLKLHNSQRDLITNIMDEFGHIHPSQSHNVEEKIGSSDQAMKRSINEQSPHNGSSHAVHSSASSIPTSKSHDGRSDESDFDFSRCFAELSKTIVPYFLEPAKLIPALQTKIAQLLEAESILLYFKTADNDLINNPFSTEKNETLNHPQRKASVAFNTLASGAIFSFRRKKDDLDHFKSRYVSPVDSTNIPSSQISNLIAYPFAHDISPVFSSQFSAVIVCVNIKDPRFLKGISSNFERVLSFFAVHLSTLFSLAEAKHAPTQTAEQSSVSSTFSTTSVGSSLTSVPQAPTTEAPLIKELGSIEDVDALIGNLITHVSSLTLSERCIFFRWNEYSETWVSNQVLGASKDVKRPKNHGIEGLAATTREAIVIPDAVSDSRVSNHIMLEDGVKILNIVCVPVIIEDHVVGVFELVNKRNGLCTGKDVRTINVFASLCGLILHNYSLNKKCRKLGRTIEAFLGASSTFRSGNDVASMVRAIMSQAQDVVNADRFTVFEVDRMGNEIKSKISIGMGDISIPMGQGIVGHVVSSEEPIIVGDVSLDSRFYDGIDKRSGYHTRDVMCVPIFNKVSDLVGAVEMVNKKSDHPFEKEDLEILKAFTSFLSMSLTNLSDLNNPFTMDDVRLKGSLEYFEKRYRVPQSAKDTIADINFKCWEYSVDEIVGLFVYMFEDLGFISKYRINKLKLFNFLLKCQSLYRSDVPYHNFVHAFDVTHCTYLFYKYCDMSMYLSEVEIFGLFVACVCHDLDHRGFNNAFQVKMKSPIALLYNNVAVMENHHCATAVTILSIPENNILEELSESEYGEVWQVIISSILATDMASHFEYVSKVQKLAQEKNYTKENQEHRKLLANILIKCSDISNIAKPFPLAKHWADVVTVEFFNQGDAEKKYNLPVTPIMDREKVILPQMQMGFIGAIGVPIFSHLAEVTPGLSIFRDCTIDNKEQWNAIFQSMQQTEAPK